ncbi:MAG: type II toxin-antitoxin system RelE/ParE family toxin [Elusimicrobia bacterium]|nr:type II toxin-antitoxin system RelE/ParE family toxin [Elusimicrobiota bacterium]
MGADLLPSDPGRRAGSVILTNAFVKKTRRVPEEEIHRASRRRELRRKEDEKKKEHP